MMSRVVQSLGFAFLFIPINVLAFQHIPPEKTSYAAGLMNLVRNIGGSTGIAIATTMLARRAQFHQANLVGHLAPGEPAYQGFLDRATQLGVLRGGLSPVDASHLAQGAAYSTVVRQSNMMAFPPGWRHRHRRPAIEQEGTWKPPGDPPGSVAQAGPEDVHSQFPASHGSQFSWDFTYPKSRLLIEVQDGT